MKQQLQLYYFPQCPFCIRVLDTIQRLNITTIELLDIRQNPQHRQKLESDTGRSTVPCLYIDDQPMHESSDIIQWLENNREYL